ncbi:MAG: METTL5 family protein [Methermicoccaceae archaeon]
MRKRELEIVLEGLEGFSHPKLYLEQYPTPASIAAQIVHLAHMMGDTGGLVYDLGCGTGVLGIAAKLMGAEQVVGMDIDADAIATAHNNAHRLGVDIELLTCDIAHPPIERDAKGTVLMNPPFGAQRRGADRVFLRTAIEIGEVIYSIHNEGSRRFVERFIELCTITHTYRTTCPIRRAYSHHTHEVVELPVEIYRIKVERQK